MSVVRLSGVLLLGAGVAGLLALLFGDAVYTLPVLTNDHVFFLVCAAFLALAVIGGLLIFVKADARGGPSR